MIIPKKLKAAQLQKVILQHNMLVVPTHFLTYTKEQIILEEIDSTRERERLKEAFLIIFGIQQVCQVFFIENKKVIFTSVQNLAFHFQQKKKTDTSIFPRLQCNARDANDPFSQAHKHSLSVLSIYDYFILYLC
jgi:hypothetical protein